jgi:alginate O-acetyltransferase complex protein AlgI
VVDSVVLFNSFEFLGFFLIVTSGYFLVGHSKRWALLLAASYFFYACWEPAYLLLIIASTLTDYWVGLSLSRTDSQRRKNGLLALSLALNLGILFAFKYYDFFRESAAVVLTAMGWQVHFTDSSLLLPVGISFYTFQTLAYTIDVYRGRQEPVTHLGHFALYVTFFPQLVAGPIERAGSLLPQFNRRVWFEYERVKNGIVLMLWGLFKKVAVADRLGLLVDEVYKNADQASGPDLILATVAFAYQIYCDFSGYSDIAIGAAAVLGIRLMDNFNRPYSARSIREFWGRWHISLSTWFRDYVYRPLGGNRVEPVRWGFNVFVVFALSGLWHGANWTYVIWGVLHCVYYLVARALGPKLKLPSAFYQPLTFAAVCFSYIFFRASTVSEAWLVISRLGSDWIHGFAVVGGLPVRFLLLTLFTLVLMLGLERLQGEGPPRGKFQGPTWARWTIYLSLIFSLILLGNYDSHAFIYFQF